MDSAFLTAVITSSTTMLANYTTGMFAIIQGIGPAVLGLIALGIFIGFVIWLLHRPKRIGRSGK